MGAALQLLKLPLLKSRCWSVLWVKTAPSACWLPAPNHPAHRLLPCHRFLIKNANGTSYCGTMASTPESCCTLASFRAKEHSLFTGQGKAGTSRLRLIWSSSLPLPLALVKTEIQARERIKRESEVIQTLVLFFVVIGDCLLQEKHFLPPSKRKTPSLLIATGPAFIICCFHYRGEM